MISTFNAHLLCVLFVAVDCVARAWRLQWLLRGTGSRMSFGSALATNLVGDAACALTPMRLGGEPVRIWGMLRAGVTAPAAFVAVSVEILAAWPVIVVAAGLLLWAWAPEWLSAAWPRLTAGAGRLWPWLVVVALLTVLAWLGARRLARHPLLARLERPAKRVRVYWRRMPFWPVLASVPMTLLDLVSRTGLLVVLAMTEPSGMAMGPLFVGSFILLYAQLILPTPSGAGVVDLGLLGGAAGDLGGATLFWWRFYSSGAGIILGAVVLLWYWLPDRAARRVRFLWSSRKEPTAS